MVTKLSEGDPAYSNCEYASTAAEESLGDSLAYDGVVGAAMKKGRSVRLFEATMIALTICVLATETAQRDDRLIGTFRDGLPSEAGNQVTNSTPIHETG